MTEKPAGDLAPTEHSTETVNKTTTADVLAIAAKGGLGAIPFVGALAAEVISTIIPGQRLDRITAFMVELSTRLEGLEQDFINSRVKSPEGVDLLEDCFHGAARALTEDRIQYLANLYASGMTGEQVDHERNKKMASLLSQLSDAEVIWLAHVAQFRGVGDPIDKHEEVLLPRVAYLGSSTEEVDEAELQDAWQDRLTQLGLAKRKIKRPMRSGELPEFDAHEGDWRRGSMDATWLGRMLLGYIGIEEPLRAAELAGNDRHVRGDKP